MVQLKPCILPHQNNTFQITLIGTIGWALNCTNRISYSQFRDSNSNESRRSILFDNEQKLALMAIWVHSDVTNYSDNDQFHHDFHTRSFSGLPFSMFQY